jgi:hypothetical protein
MLRFAFSKNKYFLKPKVVLILTLVDLKINADAHKL